MVAVLDLAMQKGLVKMTKPPGAPAICLLIDRQRNTSGHTFWKGTVKGWRHGQFLDQYFLAKIGWKSLDGCKQGIWAFG